MSRVCVFGDSITWGSWDPVAGGWVGRLREAGCNRLDLSDPDFDAYTAVYNCGISGNRIADLLLRIDAEAQAREPAVIVLAIGINDVPHDNVAGTEPDEFARRYEKLIAIAKHHATDVVAVTPTNVDESRSEHDFVNADIASLVRITQQASVAHGMPVVDVFGLMTPDDLKSDGLHPGPAGHQKLFEAIAPVVFSSPALNA